MRSCAAIHWLGGQDHQLPDRRVRHLCVAPRPCLHRPGALSAEGWTDDPARLKAAHVPERGRFCDQTSDRAHDDRARDRRARCRLPSLRRTACTARRHRNAMLRKAGKGYVLGVASNHVFNSLGQEARVGRQRRGNRQRLPKGRDGGACRRAKEPKVRGCTTGPISNWPISMPKRYNSDTLTGQWTRGLLIRRNIADGDSPSSPLGAPRARPDQEAGGDGRAIAGPSRTASRPPRTSLASTTTRPDPGTVGTGTSRWSCSPSP